MLTEDISLNSSMSYNCRDLILKLIAKDKTVRLGANGIEEILSHPWLKNINWRSLYQQKIKVPYKPNSR